MLRGMTESSKALIESNRKWSTEVLSQWIGMFLEWDVDAQTTQKTSPSPVWFYKAHLFTRTKTQFTGRCVLVLCFFWIWHTHCFEMFWMSLISRTTTATIDGRYIGDTPSIKTDSNWRSRLIRYNVVVWSTKFLREKKHFQIHHPSKQKTSGKGCKEMFYCESSSVCRSNLWTFKQHFVWKIMLPKHHRTDIPRHQRVWPEDHGQWHAFGLQNAKTCMLFGSPFIIFISFLT